MPSCRGRGHTWGRLARLGIGVAGSLAAIALSPAPGQAAGPAAPSNKLWFKQGLSPQVFDPAAAAKLLASDGFRLEKSILRDRSGHAVEFSIVTNAGSKTRERMAAMIQQDLAKLGIKINIVTLEFPSLIERITRTLDYETCLLGLVNIDIDPSGLMNVLLSSAGNHRAEQEISDGRSDSWRAVGCDHAGMARFIWNVARHNRRPLLARLLRVPAESPRQLRAGRRFCSRQR